MPGPAVLEGERITLNTVEEEDLELLRDGVNDPSVRVSAGQVLPSNGLQEREWFEETSTSKDVLQLLVVVDGEYDDHDDRRAGVIEFDPIDRETGTVDVAYWLRPAFRRNGYAREALELMVDYAFAQLRIHRVSAAVYDFNEASMRLLESIGFTAEGVQRENAYVDGRYCDTHYFGLLEDEWNRG
ncbi:Protein N-acetyltransferase, RimJ/RimL family [Halogranum gelatinilyticum]|uniref:Protein N-acetyltransferase, RimJ/RimL family n=1 Tax=Halogranum gelatinilyticum TaxID=660521 RepID=A0A1G9T7L1_9EURY|nr:GNAT family protein [Halogranum gelatinilyticum]SDM43065.1 Protein N-acetyltransferase, RimJ/RimL family [Halogranum gelatinilyticum]